MKKGKLFGLVLSLVLVVLLVSAVTLYAAKPDKPGKPDKNKPVHATDVELVKKITLKGRPSWAGGGKKEEAATGVLGELAGGDKYAVVVGISDYPGEAYDLNYCDDDASEMNTALAENYGFTNVAVLTDGDATRSAILTAIEDIEALAGADDEVVFFFSGHGAKGNAKDWDKERIDEGIVVVANDGQSLSYIWDGELQLAFSGFATSRVIFIFDTCLAGGMKKDLDVDGRVIAMATTERGTAYESDTREHGYSSYYFVDEGMLQGKANTHDYNADGTLGERDQVTVEEAFDYAKANCDYDKPTIGDSFEDDLLL